MIELLASRPEPKVWGKLFPEDPQATAIARALGNAYFKVNKSIMTPDECKLRIAYYVENIRNGRVKIALPTTTTTLLPQDKEAKEALFTTPSKKRKRIVKNTDESAEKIIPESSEKKVVKFPKKETKQSQQKEKKDEIAERVNKAFDQYQRDTSGLTEEQMNDTSLKSLGFDFDLGCKTMCDNPIGGDFFMLNKEEEIQKVELPKVVVDSSDDDADDDDSDDDSDDDDSDDYDSDDDDDDDDSNAGLVAPVTDELLAKFVEEELPKDFDPNETFDFNAAIFGDGSQTILEYIAEKKQKKKLLKKKKKN